MQHMVRGIVCLAFAAGVSFAASAEGLSVSGLTAQSYVQRGLIANWDGIENAVGMDGLGRHDAAAKVWTDLVSGFRFTLNNVTVGESYLEFNGIQCLRRAPQCLRRAGVSLRREDGRGRGAV